MRTKIAQEFEFGGGASAKLEGSRLIVSGALGSVSKTMKYPNISVKQEGQKIIMEAARGTKREKKVIFTFAAHMKNMQEGVTKGFTYRLKICSGHFPINVSLKDNTLSIKNFFGEHFPRNLEIKQGAQVKLEGDQITVTGIDKELVSQVAADIEQLTKRQNFDTRIYQDGIYITDKNGKLS